jgi:hypothetical protein
MMRTAATVSAGTVTPPMPSRSSKHWQPNVRALVTETRSGPSNQISKFRFRLGGKCQGLTLIIQRHRGSQSRYFYSSNQKPLQLRHCLTECGNIRACVIVDWGTHQLCGKTVHHAHAHANFISPTRNHRHIRQHSQTVSLLL